MGPGFKTSTFPLRHYAQLPSFLSSVQARTEGGVFDPEIMNNVSANLDCRLDPRPIDHPSSPGKRPSDETR